MILIDYVWLTFMTFSTIHDYGILEKLMNEHYFLYECVLNETFNQSLFDF